MVSDSKLANAVGGKTARACDNCIRKRARWYCAADDAFLCQSCDASVHSANPLARRHERVQLKISSIKSFEESSLQISVPSWHRGYVRKPRTPRHKRDAKNLKSNEQIRNPLHLVPEVRNEELSNEENEEQLLYRVPIFDPFVVAELCTSAYEGVMSSNNADNTEAVENTESKAASNDLRQEMNHLHGFLPSEMDLAEFAADVESLLGKGFEEKSFDIEGLGLLSCEKENHDSKECSLGISEKVKVEDEEVAEIVMAQAHENGTEIDLERETFEFNFDYDDYSPTTGEAEVDTKAQIGGEIIKKFEDFNEVHDYTKKKKKIMLNLDYEGVLSSWDDQRSPWTTGERPELDSDDCWTECMGTCGTMNAYGGMGMGVMSGHGALMVDGGREARVSRYREKRRTRLFSKKIRYEVRKLNAEKRPRMKGRFVKGANFVAPAFPLLKK